MSFVDIILKVAGVFAYIGVAIQSLSALFFFVAFIVAMFADPSSIVGLFIVAFYGLLAYLFFKGGKRLFSLKKDMLNYFLAVFFLIIPLLVILGFIVGFVSALIA